MTKSLNVIPSLVDQLRDAVAELPSGESSKRWNDLLTEAYEIIQKTDHRAENEDFARMVETGVSMMSRNECAELAGGIHSTYSDAAPVAAIAFALDTDNGLDFLRNWSNGEFDVLRKNGEAVRANFGKTALDADFFRVCVFGAINLESTVSNSRHERGVAFQNPELSFRAGDDDHVHVFAANELGGSDEFEVQRHVKNLQEAERCPEWRSRW